MYKLAMSAFKGEEYYPGCCFGILRIMTLLK